MGLLGVVSAFLSWLFRASLVFAKLREVHFTGQQLQYLDEAVGAHFLKETPFVFWYRDHHAIVGALQMARQVKPDTSSTIFSSPCTLRRAAFTHTVTHISAGKIFLSRRHGGTKLKVT
jgi:hypothetical protein